MNESEIPSNRFRKNTSRLFWVCISISLLLHLGIAILLNSESTLRPTEDAPAKQQPTIVRLVDKPRQLELDPLPKPVKEEQPTQPARLAERNQRVEKEQAPEGQDSRDQAAQPATTAQQAQPAPRQAKPQPKTTQSTPRPKPKPAAKTTPAPASKPKSAKGTLPRTAEKPTPKTPEPSEALPEDLPSLAQLTQLSPQTIARSQNQGRREKIKEREGVEEGNTVWLNLEKGLLISFFRRFRNQIEGVWNYPMAAARNGVEGILLLKIKVNRQGELLDVELIKTSGSDLLDYEAIEAIYRSSPFGPLPRHYPHPELNIYAHFRYILSGKSIYGRQ